MRVLDKTIQIEDEEYLPIPRVIGQVEEYLKRLDIDTYNHRYVVRITVDEVDD